MDTTTPPQSPHLIHRKTIPLTGYVSLFGVEERPLREGVNALGYSFHYAQSWKFYVKLSSPGSRHGGSEVHYGLNLVTSDPSEATRITERLASLKESRETLSFSAPLSFTNWTSRSTDRFACGEVLGLPISVLFATDGSLPLDPHHPNSASRLTVPLTGRVELFSVEPRKSMTVATPIGYRRSALRSGWRINVLFAEDGCTPAGSKGRHGLHFYTSDRKELAYVERALSHLQETKKLLTIEAPVNYYQWMDKNTGDFRCGTILDLPIEILDDCPIDL